MNTGDQLRARVALHQAVHGRRPPRRFFARQVWPRAVEQSYLTDLLHRLEAFRHLVLGTLNRHGPAWVAEADAIHRRDAAGDQLDEDLALIRVQADGSSFSPPALRGFIRRIAARTEEQQRRELTRQLRVAVGIEVPLLDADLGPAIAAFTAENVSRVRGLPAEALEQIKRAVLTGLAAGDRWEQIAGDVAARVDVSESRAALIARDQVGKFYSSLNRTRQQNLGITHFVWRTDADERVCPICAPLDGKRFTWKDAPGGGPGHVHPNCRCTPDPDTEGLLKSLGV